MTWRQRKKKRRSLNEENKMGHEIWIYFQFPHNVTTSLIEAVVKGHLKIGFWVGRGDQQPTSEEKFLIQPEYPYYVDAQFRKDGNNGLAL